MIQKENDSVVLKLNSSLYDKESVNEAFEELKRNADAEMKTGKYFVIKIKKSRESENYGYEFLNYVLKLMKNKGVV